MESNENFIFLLDITVVINPHYIPAYHQVSQNLPLAKYDTKSYDPKAIVPYGTQLTDGPGALMVTRWASEMETDWLIHCEVTGHKLINKAWWSRLLSP